MFVMNEIIGSILEAEKKADEMIKLAEEKARTGILEAGNKAEEIKKHAISVFKMHSKAIVKKAEEEAEKLFNDKIQAGKERAEKLVREASGEFDAAAEIIVREILG